MTRADVALVERGLAVSRAKAQALIRQGCVVLDGAPVARPNQPVAMGAALAVVDDPCPWVSRGALKLVHALDRFGLEASGRVAADIGASTGGFTEVLLSRGASRVYAIDAGHGQLAASLAGDPRVVSMDRTNARHLAPGAIPEPLGAVVCDVSFISATKVLGPVVAQAAPDAWAVVLIKPQFELAPEHIGKGGIVRDPALRQQACDAVELWWGEQPGWRVLGVIDSPIAGGDGNAEFLLAAISNA